jgi:hypothetical protein
VPFLVSRAGVCQPSSEEMATLKDEFRERHCVTLKGFLDPRVVSWLRARLDRASWARIVHEKLNPPSVDLMLEDDVAIGVLLTMTNTHAVFETVRSLTGCDTIGCYQFRVYRMDAGSGHTDTWHGDDDGNRMVTLSINVGLEAFEGGALEIRERGSRRIVHRVHNTGPGDAILFEIGENLEHCVQEVTGSVSKYAVAGWFQRRPAIDLGGLVRRSTAW